MYMIILCGSQRTATPTDTDTDTDTGGRESDEIFAGCREF